MSLAIVQRTRHKKPWSAAVMQVRQHCIVLTADVVPCQDFVRLVHKLVTVVPNEPICLMLPGEAFRKAHKEGKMWCTSTDGVSGALLLPREIAQKWQSWATWCAGPVDDDSSMAAYFWSYNKRILHPMPPLVTLKTKPGWLAESATTWTAGEPYHVETLLRHQHPADILRSILQDGVQSHYNYDTKCWTCEAAQAFAP